jgi:hypothetical protein
MDVQDVLVIVIQDAMEVVLAALAIVKVIVADAPVALLL